jgi:hypothetical protein
MGNPLMLWQYLNDISTAYVFGGSRYVPYDTDCSGIVCAAVWQKLGIDPYTLGGDTGSQWRSALLEIIWQGETPDLPWGIMQEDDLIFTSIYSPNFDTANGSHVGFYTGNPEAPFLSHYADGGPYVTAVNAVYGGREKYYGVGRLKVLNNAEIIEKLDQLMKWLPAWVWEYNYQGTAPYGNMYNTLVQTNLFVQDVKRNQEIIDGKLDRLLNLLEGDLK